jgi:hypothetical protein
LVSSLVYFARIFDMHLGGNSESDGCAQRDAVLASVRGVQVTVMVGDGEEQSEDECVIGPQLRKYERSRTPLEIISHASDGQSTEKEPPRLLLTTPRPSRQQ